VIKIEARVAHLERVLTRRQDMLERGSLTYQYWLVLDGYELRREAMMIYGIEISWLKLSTKVSFLFRLLTQELNRR
jgi:hypothetical protein